MKKLTLLAATLLAALTTYGQGTVGFNNYLASQGVINGMTGAQVEASQGIVVQLYWSATMGGNFVAVGTPVAVGDVGIPFPGYFDGGAVSISQVAPPGADGQFFQVRAWETAYGATYEAAAAAAAMNGRGALVGATPTFSSDTGNPNAQPPDLPTDLGALIPNFTVNPVPEPSVIALGLLGAGALFVLRRKK